MFFTNNLANIILNLQVTIFLIYLSFIFQFSAMIRNDFFPSPELHLFAEFATLPDSG